MKIHIRIVSNILLYVLACAFIVHGQAPRLQRIDSLESKLRADTKNDSNTVLLMVEIETDNMQADSPKMGLYIDRIQSLSKKIKYSNGIALSYIFKSVNALKKASYKSSLTFASEALKFAQISKNPNTIGQAYWALGNIHLQSVSENSAADANKALAYFRQYLFWSIQGHNKKNEVASYQNIALAMVELNQYQEALKVLYTGIKTLNAINEYPMQAYYYNLLGRILMQQEKFKKAIPILKKAELLAEKYNVGKVKMPVYFHLGKSYFGLNDLDKAETYFIKSVAIATKNGSIAKSLRPLDLLSRVYQKQKNYARAIEIINEYNFLRDSIITAEKNVIFLDMQTKYETKQKEQENKLLKFENKAIQNQNYLYLAILFAGLLLLVSSGLLYYKLYLSRAEVALANQFKDRLFTIVAHDIKRPTISFQNLTRTLNYLVKQKRFDDLSELGVEAEILAANMNLMIDNIFKWGLSEQKKMTIKITETNLNDLFEDIKEEFLYQAKVKNITLNIEKFKGNSFSTDRTILLTILRNLLSNAIKYTPEGGQIWLFAEENDTNCKIIVKDNGVGMSNEIIKTLTNNKGISKEGLKGEKGLGMGLSICQELLKYIKGSLTFISKEGAGCTVNVLVDKLV